MHLITIALVKGAEAGDVRCIPQWRMGEEQVLKLELLLTLVEVM